MHKKKKNVEKGEKEALPMKITISFVFKKFPKPNSSVLYF